MEPAQQAAQDPASGRFLPRNRANPAGRPSRAEKEARIEARARDLCRGEFGVEFEALSEFERIRLLQAAAILVRRPHSAEDAVRCANAVGRLLGAVERRRGTSKQTVTRSLADYAKSKGRQP